VTDTTAAGRSPVLVGVGLVQQRASDGHSAAEPLELMVEAALQAGRDSGVSRLLGRIEEVVVPQGRWRYRDPGRVISTAVGAKARSILAKVGVPQERLVAGAAERIAAGDLTAALIVGGEGGYRIKQLGRSGVSPTDAQQDTNPDEVWAESTDMVHEAERASPLGTGAPAYYAVAESAARHRLGLQPAEANVLLSNLYSRLSEIAAANPHAWTRRVITPTDMVPGPGNPLVASPYTRLHCSDWSVDQASALFLCSTAVAREAGIDPRRWIHPQASATAEHVLALSERPHLDEAVGAKQAVTAALEAARCSAMQLDLVELYSCFPVAMRAHADALAHPGDRDPSFTGGMRFAGGPFNNFVLHAIAQLAIHLRNGDGRLGLVSSVSGMLTKHAFGLWATEPNPIGFKRIDVTSAVASSTPAAPVLAEHWGPGKVLGHTVVHPQGAAEVAVAVVEIEGGKRCIASSTDPLVLTRAANEDLVGVDVEVANARLAVVAQR
jgi:acetyl-CoA C-acetyltransferase